MAQPIERYDGNFVTCYPGSNQTDDGKLQLEFNAARIVTRLSSKNFCVVNPSFEVSQIIDLETGKTRLNVTEGQASINGMDLIIKTSITIDAPETAGTYYLGLKLARDSSNNVLGDLIYGVTTTFEGVYLTYFNQKDETDKDVLYLAKATWDGATFNELEEDEDKYGRIWAEDILCKIDDPKHPNITRLLLQEWLYKVPDWYFSKEGDIIYGALEMTDGREGSGETGILLQAVDPNTSHIIVKAPTVPSNDQNRIMELIGTNNSTEMKMGKASINVKSPNYYLNITNPKDINIHSNDTLKLQGDDGVEISGGSNANSPKLTLKDHVASFTDSTAPNLKYDIKFIDANTVQQTIGKAVWEYAISNNTKYVRLLATDVDYLELYPKTDMKSSARVKDGIYLGNATTYGQETNYIKPQKWLMTRTSDGKASVSVEPLGITINNNTGTDGSSYLLIRNNDGSRYSKITDDGRIVLTNNISDGSTHAAIQFRDGTANNTTLYKVYNQQKLQFDGSVGVAVNFWANGQAGATGGLYTGNGIITFQRGTTDATITKDNNSSNLRTSGNLYIGASGGSALYAGNTTINGQFGVGASTYNDCECKIDGSGNINTSGTITGSKVFNAVYNDYAEIFEKSKDEIIEPGDAVCIKADGLAHKVNYPEDLNTVIGVCTDTEGVLLGGEGLNDDQKVKVGMVGKLWIKSNDKLIKPGCMVKLVYDGTVMVTYDKQEKFGIALTSLVDGKVKIVYNG